MEGFSILPCELKFEILSYFSYEEISKLRLVSRDFNRMAMDTLNTGFSRAEKLHLIVQKEIRSILPRRESERRNHPKSRHADILSAVETRMSLLQITYAKYIEAGYACFIPGKVLDELIKVLSLLRTSQEPPRSSELLLELRDISSMAMEHFEEKILPPLKAKLGREGIAILPGGLTVGVDNGVKRAAGSPLITAPDFKRRKLAVGHFPQISLAISPSTGVLSPSVAAQQRGQHPLERRVKDAELTIAKQNEKIEEQARSLDDLRRKLIDYNQRFNDLADVLCTHYESGQVQDRLSALIRPTLVSGQDLSPHNAMTLTSTAITVSTRDTTVSGTNTVEQTTTTPTLTVTEGNMPDDSFTSSPQSFTSIVNRDERRYGRNQKSLDKRAKLLKEEMDTFKDEVKL